jgi:hypothetical protein
MGEGNGTSPEMNVLLEVLEKEVCNANEHRLTIQTAIKRIGDLREIPQEGMKSPSLSNKEQANYMDKIQRLIDRMGDLNRDLNFICANLGRLV